MQRLIQLYTRLRGFEPVSLDSIAQAGSNRAYYRINEPDGNTLIGVIGTSVDENEAFCYLSEHFRSCSLPVPEVLIKSADSTCYIQQDLGKTSLFDALRSGRESGGQYTEEQIELLRRTIRLLPRIQVIGSQGLDYTVCYPQSEFDRTNVLFDLNYFKYSFLKTTGLDFNEFRLEADFQQMATDLVEDGTNTFMYRDFQARNVMLDAGNNPWFIDFQGGRRGPLQYDVVSFLWQASARYSDDLRTELVCDYLESLRDTLLEAGVTSHTVEDFISSFDVTPWILFRTLQVLGAYGFRGYFERKKHFIESIPPAIDNLRTLLEDPEACPYPYLRQILEQMVGLDRFKPTKKPAATVSKYDGQGELTVRIFSFSYKKGIPEDPTGNGGGYVFDCRSTHNPGRYEPYKKITGLDPAVIKFLEDDGEILTFLESVYMLADAHVERYIQRGFTSLMFSFGCTGGQHRSVYSAQHLAEHLHAKYGVKVILTHREQGITQIFDN